MNLSGGLRGLAVAGAAEVGGSTTGDHAIAVAIISASSGLFAVLLTNLLSRRNRRGADSDPSDLSTRLLAELEARGHQIEARDVEIIQLRKELDRARRRPHG